MPIFEFECPKHGKFERIIDAKYDTQPCPRCANDCNDYQECNKVEFSVPAKRNPEKGIQK